MIEIYFHLVTTVATHVICSPSKNQREMRIDGYILMATIVTMVFGDKTSTIWPSSPPSPLNQKLVDLM